MDDFSIYGDDFETCLENLGHVLRRCEKTNLVLNWEKYHFMVREGTVLGHKVSCNGLEVDRAKIEAIERLPPPINVKGIKSLLGHADFYRRFTRYFSKISRPLCVLLEKNAKIVFNDEYLQAFELLRKHLIATSIIVPPNWQLSFELICDASDFSVGDVLGQFSCHLLCKKIINGGAKELHHHVKRASCNSICLR